MRTGGLISSAFQAYFVLSVPLEVDGSSLLPFIPLIGSLIGDLFWVGFIVLAIAFVGPYLSVLGSG